MSDKFNNSDEIASSKQGHGLDRLIEYGFIPPSWPDFPDEEYGRYCDLRRKLNRNLKPANVREVDHINLVVRATRQIQFLRCLQFEVVGKVLSRLVRPKIEDQVRELCSRIFSESEAIFALLASSRLRTEALFGDRDILQATDNLLRRHHQLSWDGLLVEARQQVMVDLEELQKHIEACECKRQAALKKLMVLDQRKATLLARRSDREIAKVECSPPGVATEFNSPSVGVSGSHALPANTAMASSGAPDFG